ncbi:MAG: DUF2339 domain-containing protein [Paludibacteraceae bacterium]|nr:DUF2339 domain-containing protein [Paludibacteraceae bacterium]
MDVLKEIERLENELIRLKGNQQNISIRLGTVNDELDKVIPTLKRFSQSLTEEEAEILRRLSQFQEELTQLKENCKEMGIVSVEEPAPSVQEVPQPIVEAVTQPSVPLVDKKEAVVVDRVEAPVAEPEEKTETKIVEEKPVVETPVSKPVPPKPKAPQESYFPTVDWEKFIGENLISKLGILILLIGVAIGGKYAIDHEMLSPTVRIILGTVLGLALQGVAWKLKKDYKKFSAILSSGSSAILYFMTYFAYDFYSMIPKPLAFVMMVLITAFSVFTAWWYDMEVVAIIGQVGAYVIPFLLSDGSGSVLTLLTYIVLIDSGILVISIKKYWQKLFAVAFVSSWLITVISYRLTSWDALSDCYGLLALIFALFAIFYVSTLVYKVRKDFEFVRFDIIFLLSNSFFFFALGYNLIYNHEEMVISLPLFSLFNALIHCGVSYLLYKKQLVDDALQRLILALSVTFITVSIAIATSGHWITIFWMMEALALFWVARTKKKSFYEKMSYPVLLLAMVSLMADWGNPDGANSKLFSDLAMLFSEWRSTWDVHPHSEQGVVLPWVTTILSLVALAAILWIDNRYPAEEKDEKQSTLFGVSFLSVLTLAIFVHFTQPWITLLLSLEFAVLFFFARKKENFLFEKAAYGLIVLSSLLSVYVLHEALDVVSFDEEGEWLIFYKDVLPAVIPFVLSLVAVVLTDWKIPCKEVNAWKEFSSCVRILLIYAVAFACVVVTIPFEHFVVNNSATLWTLEVLAFFFIGRYYKNPFYEKALVPLFFSLLMLWYCGLCMSFEGRCFSSISMMLLFVASLFALLWINQRYEVSYSKIMAGVLRCLISVTFACFVVRLLVEWTDEDFIYSCDFVMVFFAAVSYWASRQGLKMLAKFDFIVMAIALVAFASYGLNELGSLRTLFMMAENGSIGYYLLIRYLSFLAFAVAIALLVYYRNSPYCDFGLPKGEKVVYYDISLVLLGLVIGTSELFNIFDLLHYNESYKLALSIFWGCCSMFLIYFGLFRQMKHLRIAGFILFGVILVKLFFYDLSHLDTLSKTIVFVSLGVLLLVSSFFYQKIAKKQQEEMSPVEEGKASTDVDDKQDDNQEG